VTREAVFQVLHRGRSLAAGIAASSETRLGWVGVYPLDPKRPETAVILSRFGVATLHTDTPIYRIRKFEVDRALIVADACISEEELAAKEDVLAIGDEDLQAKLQLFGVNLEGLDLPFKSDYPL
jgi:hypothetical protein